MTREEFWTMMIYGGPKTREDLIPIAELALEEIRKINDILDNVITKCEVAQQLERISLQR